MSLRRLDCVHRVRVHEHSEKHIEGCIYSDDLGNVSKIIWQIKININSRST